MSMFRSEDVDTDVERMLCWGIVQSDEILSQVVGILSPDLFVAEPTQHIVRWCIDYYHTYRHAPREHIFDILSEECKKYLRDDVASVLTQQLEVLSSIDDDTPNKEYVLKRVETYIKERTASMLCEDVSALLSKGQVQSAEERLVTYKCPSKPIAMGESIFSPDFWDEREEEKQELFHLGGALGDLVGPIERDSFISLIASEKIGKTWYLMYLALEAIKARRNVLFISAGDMTRKQVRARLKHMLTGRDPKKPQVLVRRPIMDCYYNQIGDCPLGKETSSLIGYEEGANMEEFSDHRVCHVCASDPKNKRHYIGKPWYAMCAPGDLSIEEAYKQTQKRAMSSQFHVMCVPPRTLSVAQIEAQLDLYKQEGFVPDVIIVDYADILDDEPGSHKEDMRNRINISWMAMRRLSQERNCAFITATQAKVEARKKARVDQWDTSEDKRKLAHVTAMLALNQTPAEKREGIMRISVLAARERDFDTEYNVEVLQCLELGRPVLYSYPHRDPPKENRKTSTNKERRNY